MNTVIINMNRVNLTNSNVLGYHILTISSMPIIKYAII